MLSEGWDVKSVTHILGLRAFGSPLLTEQIIGRGLRRTNYDVLNQPLDERPEGSEETVDAFGIPFVGFPVEKRKRPRTGEWDQKPIWIEADAKKTKYRVTVPNVRSWAVGVLAGSALFRNLRPTERTALAARAHMSRFEAGETIFLTGAQHDSTMAVLSGEVKISMTSSEGKEIVLAILHPSEVFGEIAMLDDEPGHCGSL